MCVQCIIDLVQCIILIYFLSFERSKLDGKYSLTVSVCMHALLQTNVVLDIVYYFGDWMSVYIYACMGGLDQFCWVFRVDALSE